MNLPLIFVKEETNDVSLGRVVLRPVAVIDYWNSLIWVNRNNEPGECELYIPADHPQASALTPGRYLAREDDAMVCRIEAVEHVFDKDGHQLVVKGADALSLLNRRIVWYQAAWNNKDLDLVVDDLLKNCDSRAPVNRRIPILGSLFAITVSGKVTASYRGERVGDSIFDLCKQFDYNLQAQDRGSGGIGFVMSAGLTRQDVVFSPERGNVNSLKWTRQAVKDNVILIHGSDGEYYDKTLHASYRNLTYAGVDRWEEYVDGSDLTVNVTYAELQAMITQGLHDYGNYYHEIWEIGVHPGYLKIPIVDDDQLQDLLTWDPNATITTESGQRFFTNSTDLTIGVFEESRGPDFASFTPNSDSIVTLTGTYFMSMLQQRAATEEVNFKVRNYIEADLDWSAYAYRTDYKIGDYVIIDDGDGNTFQARIDEVLESYDSKGYALQPKMTIMNPNFGQLPAGYQEVSYINAPRLADNYPFIDTGFVPTLKTRARVKFSANGSDSFGYFGARKDPCRFHCTSFSSKTKFGFGLTYNAWPANKTDLALNVVYDCIAENGSQSVNGTSYSETATASWSSVVGTFKLAGLKSDGSISAEAGNINDGCRYYLCQIWDDNVLKRDMVPCYRKADNVVGMYDLANNVFYTNAGTGSFTAGPDVN